MSVVHLDGLADVIDVVSSIPTMLGNETLFVAKAAEFASVLAEATPPGWNAKLGRSVLSEGSVVGYESGVEEAGDSSLDGKPRRGRKRWASVQELETVLQDSLAGYMDGFVGSVIGGAESEFDSVLS